MMSIENFAAAHGFSSDHLDLVLQVAEATDYDESAMLARLRSATTTAEAARHPKGARGRAVESRSKRRSSRARTGPCPVRDDDGDADLLAWISRALAWSAHPVLAVHRASSTITFVRDGAPDVVLPFASLVEPKSLRLGLTPQRAADDARVPADIDDDLCSELCFAVNQLCPLCSDSAVEQAGAIFGEFQRDADCHPGEFACEGDQVARYRIVRALAPSSGLACYVEDAGRPVVAISDLQAAARRLPDRYRDVEAIFEGAGWRPFRSLQGYERPGKKDRGQHQGPIFVFRAPEGWGTSGERVGNEPGNEPPVSDWRRERGERTALSRAPAREARAWDELHAGVSVDELLSKYGLPSPAALDAIRAEWPIGLPRPSDRHVRWYRRARRFLIRRDGDLCAHCRRGFRDPEPIGVEIDHVVPLALYGRHAVDNLQLLCADCHGEKTIEDRAEIREARDD